MEKKLKSSMKENKRYLLLKTGESMHGIEKSILEFLGILGYAKASPKFIKSDKLILAVNREELDKVRSALALSKTQIIVKKVSGTIAGLK